MRQSYDYVISSANFHTREQIASLSRNGKIRIISHGAAWRK